MVLVQESATEKFMLVQDFDTGVCGLNSAF